MLTFSSILKITVIVILFIITMNQNSDLKSYFYFLSLPLLLVQGVHLATKLKGGPAATALVAGTSCVD